LHNFETGKVFYYIFMICADSYIINLFTNHLFLDVVYPVVVTKSCFCFVVFQSNLYKKLSVNVDYTQIVFQKFEVDWPEHVWFILIARKKKNENKMCDI